MRDPNDLIREQSIRLLVQAPLSAEQAKQARQEIVAQLGDVSIRVRRTAARSLGAMGPGEGGLALVRLLDDIHPEVAEAAAFGLGQIADPRTGPALQRALETPINANFAAAAVDALARLPGEDIDLALIDLLDTPPPNTRQLDIARAIGRRPEPGPELIAGLVERMRDPDLREPTSQALMWLGDRAVPALEDTLARGLEPDIAVEVQRLLDARLLEPTPVLQGGEARAVVAVPRAVPKLDDREAWFELLVDDARLDAAAVLAADAPAWFEGALAGRIDSASTAGQIAPWLVAASLSPEILGEERHALIWGKIASWASEVSGAGEERCLATLALGSAAGTRHAEFVSEELRRLAASASAEVRGCAALSLARLGDDPLLEALLADPSSRVRAMAAVAHRHLRRPGERARARMAVQADRDPEMRVRSSAAFVLAVGDERKRPQVVLLRGRSAPLGAVAQAHWQRFEVAGREIDVPMFEVGGRAWAIVPLPGAKPVEVDSAVMEMQSSPYHYEIYEYAF
nr:HEAT repeat domain-containing protein [Pseudenhygromyxa sp. WMMC2535]